MAANLSLLVRLHITESNPLDLATVVANHLLEFPGSLQSGDYLTGTTDNKQNRVFTDTRSLVATTETLDLYGGLTDAFGVAINFVEVRGIYIRNRSTVAASVLTVGNATAPAFAGLFQAATQRAVVPASGVFLWTAPLDGGGLVVTNTTADGLKLDSGAATISFDIAIWGVDA